MPAYKLSTTSTSAWTESASSNVSIDANLKEREKMVQEKVLKLVKTRDKIKRRLKDEKI